MEIAIGLLLGASYIVTFLLGYGLRGYVYERHRHSH